MLIAVHKYGGSSLATVEAIRKCAMRSAQAHQKSHALVIVVSAMGDTTDQLLEFAQQQGSTRNQREVDALLATGEQITAALMTLALRNLGIDAITVTGSKLGIFTDDQFGDAQITNVEPTFVNSQLKMGRVVVAPGFQGIAPDGSVSILGRGGSDITAIALAAALGIGDEQGSCEILTDVDGIYCADPNLVPGARKFDSLSHETLCRLTEIGAGVLHHRAAEIARRHGVPIHVRHSIHTVNGTHIGGQTNQDSSLPVIGCAIRHHADSIHGDILVVCSQPWCDDEPATRVRNALENAGLTVDKMHAYEHLFRFTVRKDQATNALCITHDAVQSIASNELASKTIAGRSNHQSRRYEAFIQCIKVGEELASPA